jgi:hypothetical protein
MDDTIQRNGRVMMEADGYPCDWVLGVAEFILLWEESAYTYEHNFNGYLGSTGNTYPIPTWWCNVPIWNPMAGTTTIFASEPDRIVHTIWSYTPNSLKSPRDPNLNPSDMAEFNDVLTKVQGWCAGSVHLTDKYPKIFDEASYLVNLCDAVPIPA